MKFAESSNQAAEYLRQAIPLMVKYSIAPNPLNYALWYTYVSNRLPELNNQLDKTLDAYGTCPTLLSEQLFRDHMIRDEINSAEDVQSSLINLINDLHKHADATVQHTSEYGDVLEQSLEALNESMTSPSPSLETIIHTLSTNTQAIGETNKRFQERINAAQAEIKALKDELQKTRQDARIDPLTGLFNRRVFDAELSQLTSLATPAPLTLLLMDIDHFKHFNDEYGHLMGDKVLQYFGKLLKDESVDAMLPVRFGGEEFALLLPGSNLDNCVRLAETLRAKVQAIRIKQKKSGDVISSISASFGVAQLLPGETAEALIDRADKALYSAKQQGRNRVEVA